MSRGVDKAIRIAFGLIICAFFGYSQYVELRTPPPHAFHIAVFSLGFLVGAAVAVPRLVVIIGKVSGIVGPYIPGGRRAYDPPAPPKDAP